ncbi:hypothetical protein GH714_035405 [Hevea brasiliensis]|uniref:Uncharacterized protein n=1 Tax=Hevea brasiliensis TaxID=3981 RepID=A0A6A6LX69_HEVBR|nr:hypothetical protein GH714_035405 [Hevea brasiliensis]
MMGYWKSKVLPKIKKEEITREFEEKKTELLPKVLEIYEASSAEIKALVKEPKEAGLKKYSALVQKFLEELAKIEFPGSKTVTEAASKREGGGATTSRRRGNKQQREGNSGGGEKKEEVVVEAAKSTTEPVVAEAETAVRPPAAAEPASKVEEVEAAAEPPKP